MKVQVLLSTYNGEDYVKQQVASILEQRDVDVKLLIRDDGSSDNTRVILSELQQSNPEQIEVVYGENVGVTPSFFNLLVMSDQTYDYFAFADQDDVWFDNKLKVACQHIQENEKWSSPFLYVGNYTPVDANLKPIEAANEINREVNYAMTLVENIALGCTMVMNQALRNEIVRCDVAPAIIHDWYVYLLAQTIGGVYVDSTPTMFYRQHENNVIGNKSQGIQANLKKITQLFDWANDNKKQLQFIEMNYAHIAHGETLKILSEYTHISEGKLQDRIRYNKVRTVRRTSRFHDKALSLLILMKKV